MIDKLRSIAIFATVVDQGTFRAAANHIGLAPSRVSQAVSDLEKELDVTLLYRSTRQLSLTQEGRLLYDQASIMLNAVEQGIDAINTNTQDPVGSLRITAPAFVTQTSLVDTLADFAKALPKVSVSLDFSDYPRDLIKDGFDLSIRAGWLEDSEFMTRSIGEEERILVASPAYVAKRPAPNHPSDLEDWDWIRFSIRPAQTVFTPKAGESVTVMGKSHMAVNSASALYEMALRGLGLAAIPAHLAGSAIARGELVRLMPDWSLRKLGLHLVWPDKSRRENLTLVLVRFLAENYANKVTQQ